MTQADDLGADQVGRLVDRCVEIGLIGSTSVAGIAPRRGQQNLKRTKLLQRLVVELSSPPPPFLLPSLRRLRQPFAMPLILGHPRVRNSRLQVLQPLAGVSVRGLV